MLKTKPKDKMESTAPRAPVSAEVVEWLSGKAPKPVEVTKLAVDFYLLRWLASAVGARAEHRRGFDPAAELDCNVYADPLVDLWATNVDLAFRTHLGWLDSFFFTYLCAATAGEVRHYKDKAQVPEPLADRLSVWSLKSGGKRPEVQARFLKKLHAENAREYLQLAIEIFGCTWTSAGFGGPKWREIAQTGYDRAISELPPLVFVDRVFDLKHNGGPMFDKNPAVIQGPIGDFLEAKLRITEDAAWRAWLPLASATVQNLILEAKALELWRDALDRTSFTPKQSMPQRREKLVVNFTLSSLECAKGGLK